MKRTISQGLNLIPHTEFGYLDWEKNSFCVHCQNERAPPAANRHADRNLTLRHAPEAPILSSVHSGLKKLRLFLEMPDLGVNCRLSPFEGADLEREQNLTSSHRPDASYLICY